MKIKFIALIVFILTFAMSVNAFRFVSTLGGTNNSAQTSGTYTMVFTPFCEGTMCPNCNLYINATSANNNYDSNKTFSSITNNTVYSNIIRELPNSPTANGFRWGVNCTNSTNTSDSTNPSFQLKIDSVLPVPYFNNQYPVITSTNGNFTINISIYDINPEYCQLYGNYNLTNSSATSNNVYVSLGGNQPYTNGGHVTFGASGLLNRSINSTGTFRFYASCNDTAGQIANTSILTVLRQNVSTQGSSGCASPANNSIHSTLATFRWNPINTGSFRNYNLVVNSSGTMTNYTITNNDTSTKQITLSGDANTFWYVQTFDANNNLINSSANCSAASPMKVSTTSVCSNLIAGWNACAWENNDAVNLSALYSNSGATYASAWNYTNGSFVTYTGNSSGADFKVKRGNAYWLYMSAAASWENDHGANLTRVNFSLSNLTTGPIVPIGITNLSGDTLGELMYRVNKTQAPCSGITATLLNQSSGASKVAFCGFAENNNTLAKIGNVVFLEWNDTKVNFINITS